MRNPISPVRGALSTVRCLAAAATSLTLLLTVVVASPDGTSTATASPVKIAAVHYVTLSGSPGMPELDSANDTIYVPIQCPKSYCPTSAFAKVVDIVSSATCNATDGSGCHVVATAPGDNPIGAAVDPTTGTVYVMNSPPNANSTISLLDGRTCNATVTSGCRHAVATVDFGSDAFIVAGAVDPATRTLYVASPTHGVYVVDIAACNDVVTAGCTQRPELIKDPRGAVQLAVDTGTNTVYVADNGNPNNGSGGNTVAVIDGRTCDADNHSGCEANPLTVTAGGGVSWVSVDQANGTVYVANANDGTVSVIDGARCDSVTSAGCNATPRAVRTGAGANSVVFDPQDHTVFALNTSDDTISPIDTATCNGATPSACPVQAPAQREEPEVSPGGHDNDLIVTPGNATAYAVNEGGANVLRVTSVSGCTALEDSACLVQAPSVPEAGVVATLDPATGTLYVSNADLPQVDVINAARCNLAHLGGCTPVAKIPTGGSNRVSSVDDATHTLYVSEASSNSVVVVNTTTCNATDVSGCAAYHASIAIGEYPGIPLLDEGTGALYVPFGATTDEVAVADTQACNAEVTSGCSAPRGTIHLLPGTYNLALDAATGTVYAANSGDPFASGNTVSVINGANCLGTMAGCGKVAAVVDLGAVPDVQGGPAGPDGIAVDDATHTLYIADNHDGDLPGRLTLVNTATCNGFVTTGCHGTFPTVVVGTSPRLAEYNEDTGLLYVTNYSSTDVSVLATARCNAESQAGCPVQAPEVVVGSQPNGLAVDEATGTVFILSLGAGTMSLLGG